MTPIETLKTKRNLISAKTYLIELDIFADYETKLNVVKDRYPDMLPYLQMGYYYEFLRKKHNMPLSGIIAKLARITRLSQQERFELRRLANEIINESQQV